jgi:hypothetical protein
MPLTQTPFKMDDIPQPFNELHDSLGDDVSSDGTLSDPGESDASRKMDVFASCRPQCIDVDPCDDLIHSNGLTWTSFSLTSPQDKGDEIVVQPLCGYRVAVPCLNLGSGLFDTFDDLDFRWYSRFSPSSDGRLQRIFSLWITVLERMTEIPLTSDNVLVGILVLRHTYLRWYGLCLQKCAIESKDVRGMLRSCLARSRALDLRLNELMEIPSSREIMIKVGY